MNGEAARALEGRLAALLYLGTWLASAVIAVGIVMPHGARVEVAGIVLLVALPVVRVIVMCVDFVRRGDYRIGAIAALVLAVIGAGVVLSMHAGGGAG